MTLLQFTHQSNKCSIFKMANSAVEAPGDGGGREVAAAAVADG